MTKFSFVFAVLVFPAAGALPSGMHAQQSSPATESSSLASADLPDSPGTVMERNALPADAMFQGAGKQTPKSGYGAAPSLVEPKDKRVIPADHTAQPLSSQDKILLSLRSRATVGATASTLMSTSIAYWRNNTPHYGTNLPAFGERFGAAELRQTSQAVLSYGLYAAAFHEDPRYYVMGPKETVSKRAFYAATRAIVTRKDDGSSAPNWSRILGVVSAVALTNAYYPAQDRSISKTFTSSISIIGTTAGSNEMHEFIGDIRKKIFHKKQDADKP